MDIQLDEVEILGLKIVALAQTGGLDTFKCSACSSIMREKRMCDGVENSETPVFYHPDIGEFYKCPMRFIPNSIGSFIERYNFYEKYPNAMKSFEETNPRYWKAVTLFEQFKTEFKSDNNTTGRDSENVSRLKSLIRSGGTNG
jgi:hypothetical protein